MFTLYRQAHPVTGIENCVYCNLIDPVEKSLVVGGVNQLHIYRLNSDTEIGAATSGKGQEKDKSQDVKSKRMKLECVASFPLFGNIYSLQSVRIAGSPLDALLLSFRDAKLSMLEYDVGTHDLKTASLHYFEDEELKDGRCQQSVNQPVVRVDTDGRCAAMLVYGSRLVILPFRRETSTSDPVEGLVSNNLSPVQSSYIIELRKLDERVSNVIDFQFLYGYHEPTVIMLYEPLPTWAGRIAMRKDSCCIIALSLNLEQKVHPIIWSLTNLPFDCCQLFAVPKPIGGVLVFAVNSLIYLNQSFPPFGVSLNSIANTSSDFMLKTQEGVRMTLDCAQACFISPEKLVVSLKGGELYVLTLITDTMRAVRSFNLDKAAASVLTTCMCVCDEGFVFLGSRLGNSLLLRYTEKTVELIDGCISVDTRKDRSDEPANKKRKEALEDWISSNLANIDDLDELEVYGSDVNQSGSQVTQYTFEVCDSILNIGPCGQVVMGEPAFLSEEFNVNSEPDIELVTTSGYGKNGAISVLQRSIRPQIVTTFDLDGCTDMWTVTGEEQAEEDEENETEEESEGHAHTLLILSRQDSSMVLKTGQEIMELDHSGFSTQGSTVYSGNIGNNSYIVQVSAMGVRLLQGVKQLQHIPVDVGSPIVSCSVADPHIMIMSKQGHIIQLVLKPDKFGTGSGSRLAISKPNIPLAPKIVTLCAYKDESGLFTTAAERISVVEKIAEPAPSDSVSVDTSLTTDKNSVDDEDELLYGAVTFPKPETFVKKPEKNVTEKPIPIKEMNHQPTFWVTLCRENGVLEIYSLPEMKLSYLLKNFPIGHRVLVDSFPSTSDPAAVRQGNPEKAAILQEMPVVQELLLVGLGNKRSRPYLMARVGNELLVYEAFPHHLPPVIENNLKIRFKKVNHNVCLRDRLPTVPPKDLKDVPLVPAEEPLHLKWLRPFDDISGYSGVFLCGPYPHWMFMTSRGILRIHPMSIDGAVTCFTPFHNVNCPKGFLYFNGKNELRIAVLPGHLSYDAPWPVRKVPLRCTPYYLAYHMESKTYGVATATAEPCNRLIKVIGDGDKEFENLERDDRFVYPLVEKFSIQLFSPVTWEAIPNSRYELEEFERVTCMQMIDLRSEGTVSGFKGYIVCGTNYAYGEDVTSRGRVIILDVIEVVPEPGQPLTKNKFKVEYDKEQKGAVSAIAGVQGFLVTAIGQKIYIWQLKEGGLRGVAFIDAQVYVHSICSIKNLILIGDVYKSITLLRYQEDMKVLSLVSRDIRPSEVYSAAFLVNNKDLSFLVSDRHKNLLVYSYLPEVRESSGGQRLILRADFNVGTHINSFFRIHCKTSDPTVDVKSCGSLENRHVTYFATLDGSIGFLLPIPEKSYRRLLMLQNTLNSHLPHLAGLNPKAYRTVQYDTPQLNNPHRGVLDGELLWKFFHLSITERKDVARRIGTTVDQMINDLIDIDRITAHF